MSGTEQRNDGGDAARLIERQVTLRVSQDTMALWEALAARLGLDSFDALCQALALYGAFLPASADLGHMEGLDVRDLSPDAMRAVFVPWLRRQAQEARGERREGTDHE